MTAVFSRLLSFTGRHWLRLLIIGAALLMLSRKQVNFNVRLGAPAPAVAPAGQPEGVPVAPANLERPVLTEAAPAPVVAQEKAGFLERFNLFGGSSGPSYYDQLARQEEQVIAAFIRRFSNVAKTEQEKFGIPASIVLAKGLLLSRAGQSPAARQQHNFFNLPCGKDWPGPTGEVAGKCLREYENAWTSFRDYSLYITSGKYKALTQFHETDYRRWAAGLDELEFGDATELGEQLIRTIDKYQLFQFD